MQINNTRTEVFYKKNRLKNKVIKIKYGLTKERMVELKNKI